MKLLPRFLFALVAAGAIASQSAAAKEALPASPPASSPFAGIAAATETVAEATPSSQPALPPNLFKADLEDQAKHMQWQRKFSRESWDWHLYSTKLLLYVVMSIVAFGLLITYLQFTRDGAKVLRSLKAMPSAPAGSGPSGEDTATPVADGAPSTLKLSAAGIEITSQVIGLLVLAFSLGFFYLYVKVVYPMQEVELQKHAQSVTSSDGDSSGKK
jgi:hypothetical protein